MTSLTSRQKAVLEFISEQIESRGFPPSVREIGEAVGLTSSSSVHAQLASLQKLGYLRRDPTKPRALEIRFDPESWTATDRRPARYIPLVGEIAAGRPILAAESIEEAYPIPSEWIGDGGTMFMLIVKGDSMIDAGIFDGDYVIIQQQKTVQNGEIVAALIDGEEATVKRFFRTKNRVILRPENKSMSDMEFEDGIDVLGVVRGVFRKIR